MLLSNKRKQKQTKANLNIVPLDFWKFTPQTCCCGFIYFLFKNCWLLIKFHNRLNRIGYLSLYLSQNQNTKLERNSSLENILIKNIHSCEIYQIYQLVNDQLNGLQPTLFLYECCWYTILLFLNNVSSCWLVGFYCLHITFLSVLSFAPQAIFHRVLRRDAQFIKQQIMFRVIRVHRQPHRYTL